MTVDQFFIDPENANQVKAALTPEQQAELMRCIELIDNYNDDTSYGDIIGDWMDEQGYYDTLADFYNAYIDLRAKLKEANLVTIEPYQAVETIIELMAPLGDGLTEATAEHDNEPRPSRMERPDISGTPPVTSCWPGFYIGDQLHSILVDKYGEARGEKTFDGLLDTGNNAIYKVCSDIMREKFKMLQDLGEDPHKIDYFDVNYFNLWKTWVANKGRKATKTGQITPHKLEEVYGEDFNKLVVILIELARAHGIEDRFVQCVNKGDEVILKMHANKENVDKIISMRQTVRGLAKNKDLDCACTMEGQTVVCTIAPEVAHRAPQEEPVGQSQNLQR